MSRRRVYVRDARGRFADVPGSANRARRRRRRRGAGRVGAAAVRRQIGPVQSLGEGVALQRRLLTATAGAKIVTGLAVDVNDLHHVLHTTSKRRPVRAGHHAAYRRRSRVINRADRLADTALGVVETGHAIRDTARTLRGAARARQTRLAPARARAQKARRSRVSRAGHQVALLTARRPRGLR